MTDIAGKSLAHCDVAVDGSEVRINLEAKSGDPLSVTLPVNCIQQLLMTLPDVISRAIKAKYGDDSLRLVFPLDDWKLETCTNDAAELILTLRTTDGFEVSFSAQRRDIMQMAGTAKEGSDARFGKPIVLN